MAVSLALIVVALRSLDKGRPFYENYLGLAVFAPFAILVGAVGVLLVLLAPFYASRRTDAPPPAKRSNSRAARLARNKAERLARKAKEYSAPIDDYKKW